MTLPRARVLLCVNNRGFRQVGPKADMTARDSDVRFLGWSGPRLRAGECL
jgi:hypothetical protein